MTRLTRPAPSLTTRKVSARPAFRRAVPLVAALLGALAFSGCATPGPTHAYLANRNVDHPIIDRGSDGADVEIPTFTLSIYELYGLAYDPFTDHLFLRLFPGNYVRVVDRPARRTKRAFNVPDLPFGPGDLAVRSIDRHLFFAHPEEPALLETTLSGVTVRTIPLAGLQDPPAGVAYDQKHDRLLILSANAPSTVRLHDLAGNHVEDVTLDRVVRPVSLAYDSTAAEFYAPLRDEPAIGVFDHQGRLQRTLPFPNNRPHEFIDVGPRSFLRLF